MGKVSGTVVGSKVAALTAETIYNVAHRLTLVQADSSSLEQLAQKAPKVVTIIPDPWPWNAHGEMLELFPDRKMSDVEERATLVVLLHKLLIGQPGIRPFLPLFLSEVLRLGISLELPVETDDSSVLLAVAGSIYRVKAHLEVLGECAVKDEPEDGPAEISGIGQLTDTVVLSRLRSSLQKFGTGDFGVTKEELAAIESSSAASVGIAAVAYYSLTSLTSLADAVAGMSCEALLANTESFESESFKQAFVHKSEADVASDLMSILFNSKLVNPRKGGVDAEFVHNIPAAHGVLRESVKSFAPRLRIEMNRVEIKGKKKAVEKSSTTGSSSPSYLFTTSLMSLIMSLWPNMYDSQKRTNKILEFLREDNKKLAAGWEPEEFELLFYTMQWEMRMAEWMDSTGRENFEVRISRECSSLVETWKKLMRMELTVALAAISIREVLTVGKVSLQDAAKEKLPQVTESSGNEVTHGNAKGGPGGKGSKAKDGANNRKKEFVLGKGTDMVRRYLSDYLTGSATRDSVDSQTILVWYQELEKFSNPSLPELKTLVSEVKKVVESNEVRRLPKPPKGTRDFTPEQMAIRERAFGIIASVFKRHGACALDTPVFELREALMGKYGEDTKLIYDLADQGGEILSLRYDLTVPFARYLATNKIENLKRYHIARVYRRDNPSKGRYREFYQCDFDIAGSQYAPMVPDFEVLKVLTELLDELDIGDYEVKLNHRKFLDGMLEICGVPQSKFRSICSAIDKLDKEPWEKVRKEMVEVKGLTAEVADKIGTLVQQRGSPLVLLEELKKEGSPFLENKGSVAAMEELSTLFKYLEASKCIHRVVFDLSLARGLDYYTGVIYEAVFKGTTEVGSIAAGGRYDNLVGMFSGKQVPAVGVSLGIERVFNIMEEQEKSRKRVLRTNQTEVMVLVLGKDLAEVAIQLVSDLWAAKLKAEFACVAGGKMTREITNAVNAGIPWMVIAGENELKEGNVQLKNLIASEQTTIPRERMVAELQRHIGTK
ncbi:histidyl-tRNA synthetase [Marchantia polymorpha subsp. ruderalis]